MTEIKTALITGASQGIGRELAKIHAQKGGNLVLVARSKDKLENIQKELVSQYPIEVTTIVEELSDPESAMRVFDTTQRLGIQVDILINNAGFGSHGRFNQQYLETHQDMMQVNMVTLSDLTYYYLTEMVRRKSGQILNIADSAAFIPGPLHAVYNATKAFVASFSQAIAQEVARDNVTVTSVCPTAVATGFITGAKLEGVPVWKKTKPAKYVAEKAYSAMERGDLITLTNQRTRLLMKWIWPFLSRKSLLKLSRKSLEKDPKVIAQDVVSNI